MAGALDVKGFDSFLTGSVILEKTGKGTRRRVDSSRMPQLCWPRVGLGRFIPSIPTYVEVDSVGERDIR